MKWINWSRWLLGLYLVVSTITVSADALVVVASIRPVQWLVEALAPAGTQVRTLLPVGQSAHEYALRPNDVAMVKTSDLLVWVGPAMEPWLAQLSKNLPAERSLALQPAESRHLQGVLYEHGDGHSHEAVSTALTADPHVWLDPVFMAGAAEQVAAQLQQHLPGQKDVIQARLQVFQLAMTALDQELQSRFASVKEAGFVVYHDSYAPLVRRYGLNQRGAVWRHEAMTAGARDRAALRALLQDGSVKCVFYEPEYGREAVASWLAQDATGVRVAELDPLGAAMEDSPDAYVRLMRQLADSMHLCLQNHYPDKMPVN